MILLFAALLIVAVVAFALLPLAVGHFVIWIFKRRP